MIKIPLPTSTTPERISLILVNFEVFGTSTTSCGSSSPSIVITTSLDGISSEKEPELYCTFNNAVFGIFFIPFILVLTFAGIPIKNVLL